MLSKKKLFIGITGTLLIVLVAGFLFVRHLVVRSFPDYRQSMTTAELMYPVDIYRDEFGVPNIIAENEHDAFFAVGIVHAQDRLWQMEVTRRTGEGRLAEILGPEALRFDKLFRTIGLRHIAEATFDRLPDDMRALLERYAAGINYIIENSRGRYPVEFDMLQFEPEPWTPVHTLLIGKLMAWELNLAWWADVTMGQIIEEIEFDLAIQALPGFPADAPVIVPEELANRRYAAILRELRDVDREYRKLVGIEGSHVGSNSWVIAGERTSGGKPFLANDPHLGLSAPSRWYELSISAGEGFNVAGVSFPGIPLVVIGRNRAIAWGSTNVMADDADFYLEDIDTTGGLRYRLDDSWLDIQIREEVIEVKDNSPVTLSVYSTHRGPLVQSVLGLEPGIREEHPVSMRWTGFEASNEILTFYEINKATDYTTFRNALRHHVAPGQNFVYADTGGTIAYHPAVRLPIRPRGNPMLPFPGWDSSYEWSGFVPFDRLPELVNPPNGYIATANNKIIDDTYPYYITEMWEPPSRIQRIVELLGENETYLISDMQRMQNDYVSVHAREIVPHVLSAHADTRIGDEDISRALSYLRNWDFNFGPEDVPTTIFNVFFVRLLENTFAPRMGADLYREYSVLANIPIRAMSELLNAPDSEWFENPETPQRETRDMVLRQSLRESIDLLRERLGPDIRTWHWGTMHTITFEHMFGQQPYINRALNIGPYPVGGAGTTINNGEYRLFDPFENVLGPSMRFIVDMANPSLAYTVIPTGQSGQPLHRHYRDQTQLWLDGRYKTSSMDILSNVEYRITHVQPEERP
jgi:penicillin G amidase